MKDGSENNDKNKLSFRVKVSLCRRNEFVELDPLLWFVVFYREVVNIQYHVLRL